jgi:hypothetical protein
MMQLTIKQALERRRLPAKYRQNRPIANEGVIIIE